MWLSMTHELPQLLEIWENVESYQDSYFHSIRWAMFFLVHLLFFRREICWERQCIVTPSTFASSCWVCQEHKALTALYLGHFPGLFLLQATLKDGVVSPSGTKSKVAVCHKRMVSLSSVHLSYDANPVCMQCSFRSLLCPHRTWGQRKPTHTCSGSCCFLCHEKWSPLSLTRKSPIWLHPWNRNQVHRLSLRKPIKFLGILFVVKWNFQWNLQLELGF